MSTRFSGQTARRYDEHAEHSRRELFAKDRQIRKLTGEVTHARSTLDYIKAVVSGEVGGQDPDWQLDQVLEAASAFFAKHLGSPEPEAAEAIVRWDQVRDGDQVLLHGVLGTVTLLPHGNYWQPEGCVSLAVDGTWIVPLRHHLTAVRRKAER